MIENLKSVEVTEKIRLYNCDNMDFMKQIPDNYYDLAIVDPPYGINMDGGNVGYKGFNNFEKKNWDNEVPKKEYFNNDTNRQNNPRNYNKSNCIK